MTSTWIEINLQSVNNNLLEIKKHLPTKKIIAVVKCNAYGHGLEEISDFLKDKVEYLGVGLEEEGILLRERGIKLPILVMSPYFHPEKIIKYNLTPTIDSKSKLIELNSVAERLHVNEYPFHLKINSGLNRFGLDPEKLPHFMDKYLECSPLRMEGIFSHFSNIKKRAEILKQKDIFLSCLHQINDTFALDIPYVHMANSSVAIQFPEMEINTIRIGNALYGQISNNQLRFQKSFQLKTTLLEIKKVKKESLVGYGSTQPIEKNTKVGIIALGDADGFNFTRTKNYDNLFELIRSYYKNRRLDFKAKASIFLDGHPVEIIGQPGSQFTLLDLSDKDVNEGDVLTARISIMNAKDSISRQYIN